MVSRFWARARGMPFAGYDAMGSDGSTRRTFLSAVSVAAGIGWGCDRDDDADSADDARPRDDAKRAPAGGSPRAASGEMPMRALGSTGEQVSALGLGGAHIGGQSSRAESMRLIRTAIDGGVTFLDNCWDYHHGESERRMGEALGDGYRDRVFLMTKVDGRSRDAAAAQLEQSLARLRTDRIDLVQIHEVIREDDPARCFSDGGAIEALVAGREAGKLRYIGFTGHKHPALHRQMLELADKNGFHFDAVQMPLNVMDAHYQSFEKTVLPLLLEQNIGVLGMKSVGGGDILRSRVVSARECLRYALSLPTSVVISGMGSLDILRDNVALARDFEPLSDEERAELLARTEDAARHGGYELFKTSQRYDGTARNPHWLTGAEL